MGENWILSGIERVVEDRKRFFLDAITLLRINGITGDYLEFGSWGANSLNTAYQAIQAVGPPRHMWAFDSFQPLPAVTDPRDERWGGPGMKNDGPGGVETFHEDCKRHGIPRDAYTAVDGYFEDSLPPFGDDGDPTDLALVYVDCNMYSSTVTSFEFLAPRLKHGMIVAFDDYHLWSPTQVSGERSALHEFEQAHPEWRFQRYKDVHYAGVSFVVEHAHLLP